MSSVKAAKMNSRSNVLHASTAFKYSLSSKFLVNAVVFGQKWAAQQFPDNFAECLLLGEVIGRRLHKDKIPCYSLKFSYDNSMVEWKESFLEGLQTLEGLTLSNEDITQGFYIAEAAIPPPSRDPSQVTIASMPHSTRNEIGRRTSRLAPSAPIDIGDTDPPMPSSDIVSNIQRTSTGVSFFFLKSYFIPHFFNLFKPKSCIFHFKTWEAQMKKGCTVLRR